MELHWDDGTLGASLIEKLVKVGRFGVGEVDVRQERGDRHEKPRIDQCPDRLDEAVTCSSSVCADVKPGKDAITLLNNPNESKVYRFLFNVETTLSSVRKG